MTSLSKTTGARNGLWAEKGGQFCLLIVFLHGSACSTLLLSVRSMPKTNCCVPYCHASSTRHTRLSWHRLPKDKEIKRQWAALIRNDILRVDSTERHLYADCIFLAVEKHTAYDCRRSFLGPQNGRTLSMRTTQS